MTRTSSAKFCSTGLLLLAAIALLGVQPDAFAANPPGHVKIAVDGDRLPDGRTFRVSQPPQIVTEEGTVLWLGTLNRGPQGYFLGQPGTLRSVLAEGDAAPAGRVFESLNIDFTPVFSFNKQGEVAFRGSTLLPDQNSFDTTLDGLFLRTASGVVRLLNEGDNAPGGGKFDQVTDAPVPTLGANGQVVFSMETAGGPGEGLFFTTVSDGTANTLALALKGNPTPEGGGTFTGFTTPLQIKGLRAVNAGGQVVFLANTSTQNGGRFYSWDGTTLSLVPNSIFPDTLMLNDAGQMVWRRHALTSSPTLLTFGTAESTEIILRDGDAAPGGGTFRSVGPPSLSSDGTVAFFARLVNGPHTSGLFTWSTSTGVEAVLFASDPSGNGGFFAELDANNGTPHFGANGSLVFQAPTTGGDAIFVVNGASVARIIGVGDVLEDRQIEEVRLAAPGNRRLPELVPVNSSGAIAYQVKFKNSSDKGIFLYAPPPPKITLITPAAGRTTQGIVDITGTASVITAGSHIYASINDDPYVEAALTMTGPSTGNWRLDGIALRPGVNTVYVYGDNPTGAESDELTRDVTYVLLKPLTVTADPGGTVTPAFLGTHDFEVAAAYTVLARPNRGFLFDGWTGGSTSFAPKLTFTMVEGLTLHAHFIANPFPAVTGRYEGVLTSGSGVPEGSIGLNTTAAGTFRGFMTLHGRSLLVRGAFNSRGAATVTLKRAGLPDLSVSLQLSLTPGTNNLQVQFTEAGTAYQSSAVRLVFSLKNPTPLAGAYTFLLPPTGLPGDPLGYGYGTMRIRPAGLVTIVGKLGDGTSFSNGGGLGADSQRRLYVPLYRPKFGYLAGTLAVDPATSKFTGQMRWRRPASTTLFPAGFDTSVAMKAFPYSFAAGSVVLGLEPKPSNAVVTASGGNLLPTLTKFITVSDRNRASIVAPAADRLALTISPASGLLSGSFIDVANGKLRRFTGALYLEDRRGAGVFTGVDQSGAVLLDPAP